MATKTKTPVSDQWQQVADALGISVPQLHQQIAQIQTEAASIGQHPSTSDLLQQATKSAGAMPSQTALREGAEKFQDYTSADWAALSPQQKAQTISQYVNDPSTQLFAPGTVKKVEAAAKSPTGAETKPLPDPAKAAASIPESPYQELANSLASEYLAQVNQLMPLTSGSAMFGPQGTTTNLGNAAASAIGGSAGSWLQGLASQEQSDASKAIGSVPSLQGSMNAVGEAAAQGAIPMAGAISNTGTANTTFLEAAPWQQILSELASETAYKAASTQGSAAFGLTPQNTPAFLNQILQSHGLSGTSALGGLQTVGQAAPGGTASKSTVPGATTSPNG